MRLAALLMTVCLASGMAGLAARDAADATQAAQPTFRSGVELVEVAVLVRDREGRVVPDLTAADFQLLEGGAPQAIAAFQRVSFARIDVRATPEERERVRATGVRWLAQLDLEPGHYQVRVAGRAVGTGSSGTITCDVDVPAFEPERLAMSGVTLTSIPSVLMFTRGDVWLQTTLQTPPSAARSFVTGDQLKAGVEVYVPGLVQADLEVTADVERPDGSRTASVRTRLARGNGKSRAEEVGFPVDTSQLPPGRYVLHIVLDPSGGAAKVERHVPFEVVRKG